MVDLAAVACSVGAVSDVGWRAEGIRRARAAGGVDLELYRRPGFVGSVEVRISGGDVHVEGYGIDSDPEPPQLCRQSGGWRSPVTS